MKAIYVIFLILLTITMSYAEDFSYSVQVMTTSRQTEAAAAYTKVKEYKNARLEKYSNAYVVRIGFFRSRDECFPLLKQLKEIYPSAMVNKGNVDKHKIVKASNPDMRYL